MWEHKPCTFEGCDKPNAAHGLCAGHVAQKRRGMKLRPLRQPRPTAAEGYHWCSKCQQFRPEEDFGWDKVRQQWKRVCRPCNAASMRAYNAKNAARIRRNVRLARFAKLGITEEQIEALAAEQGAACAICGNGRRAYRDLAVDHDHVTGKLRGLLCQDCNMGLGQFKDDPDLLAGAAEYVRRHRL